MARYTVLVDGKAGAYGVVVPDMPGCTAMGETVEAALTNAAEAMRDWAEVIEEAGGTVPAPRKLEHVRHSPDVIEALPAGATLASIPLIRHSGRSAKANLSIDSGILSAIDEEAARLKLTRSALIELMAKRMLADSA